MSLLHGSRTRLASMSLHVASQTGAFTDLDMHLFVERGIRGGISMISHRFSSANNKYLDSYDENKPSKYILYLDANNLYGWAMSQPLPTHGFEWITQPIDFMEIPDESDIGYILEVDMDYPQNLHNLHNDYPLAPETLNVTNDMLSPYCKEIAQEHNLNTNSCTKLVPNLMSKKGYIVHYRNLKQYVSLGLKVTKIHKVLKFHQRPWLKKYIDFNTEKRKNAKSSFEKNLFKLLNNAVFGKTMENLRKRTVIDLVQDQKKSKKLVASPAFHNFRIITTDLVSIERKKVSLLLNRPIYIGFSILDISKILMYNFHYKYIKSKYDTNAKLLFTDTDSLCYEIVTQDVYEDMQKDLHFFDTSDYPQTHPLYCEINKKVLGKMKDELSSSLALEFVGLKPKMYSLKSAEMEKKTAKGVSKIIIQQQIRHRDYKETLLYRRRGLAKAKKIASHNHIVQTVAYQKSTLSPFDSKRYILQDGINTLAYGHFKI
ncbi:uncharacterized protein TNCV_1585101 [Trichonephila clavipes]|nr:uncharacterized protein TNCV_1585101 [Trichonephila clavipes]